MSSLIQSRIEYLKQNIQRWEKERDEIMTNYTPDKLDLLDQINHNLPYMRTELRNLEGED